MSEFALDKFVTFYVPSTHHVGKPLPVRERHALVTRVARELSNAFGGATATKGQGYYVSDTKGLIVEPVTLVKSYHECDTSEALAIVVPLAQAIKNEYGQESILIETEKGVLFV